MLFCSSVKPAEGSKMPHERNYYTAGQNVYKQEKILHYGRDICLKVLYIV